MSRIEKRSQIIFNRKLCELWSKVLVRDDEPETWDRFSLLAQIKRLPRRFLCEY
jgi:hypothetical protein